MKTIKNIGSGFWSFLDILLIVICIISIGMFIYLRFLAPEKKTEMVTYINEVENVDGKKCVVQVVYYENKDKSGEELLEVKLTGYTDTEAKELASFGIQVIGDFNKLSYKNDCKYVSKTWGIFATEVKEYYSFLGDGLGKKNEQQGRLCFYSETDDLSYKNVDSPFDDAGSIRLKIDDKMYRFSFDCDVAKSEQKLWTSFLSRSSLSLFVKNVYEKIKTVPVGNSKQTFGFKNMFKVEEFKNNQWENITNQDDVFNYCYMDFTHYTQGAQTARDSLFKQVKYNTNWTINGSSLLDEHFSDKSIYYLDENDCCFKYNSITNKHEFDITDNFYNKFKDKKNINYKLIIDLDYLKSIEVVFGGVKESNRLNELGITKYYTKTGDTLTEVII